MTMITPSYLGETIEYSSLHACRSTLEDPTDAKIADLKKSIAENEAKITQLKLDSAQKNETQARDLDKATRDLWSQLKAEDAHRKDLCRALSSVAGQKVRDLNRGVLDQFDKASQTP